MEIVIAICRSRNVTEGMFYNKEAYEYEEETGKISRNESFQGMNALFRLPADPSVADPKRAAEYIKGLGMEPDIRKERLMAELGDDFEIEGSGIGAEAAEYAMKFAGSPYEWGGMSLTEGTDSSGFTMSVYEHFGIELPHSSTEQKKTGEKIETLKDALPGDLIFYETPLHVAIYIGEGKIVHAMSSETGVCVSMADFDEIAEIRRLCLETSSFADDETTAD